MEKKELEQFSKLLDDAEKEMEKMKDGFVIEYPSPITSIEGIKKNIGFCIRLSVYVILQPLFLVSFIFGVALKFLKDGFIAGKKEV